VAIGAAQMINPRLRMLPGGSLRVRVSLGIGEVTPRKLPAAAAASSAAATRETAATEGATTAESSASSTRR
jgi:hypothetical protein